MLIFKWTPLYILVCLPFTYVKWEFIMHTKKTDSKYQKMADYHSFYWESGLGFCNYLLWFAIHNSHFFAAFLSLLYLIFGVFWRPSIFGSSSLSFAVFWRTFQYFAIVIFWIHLFFLCSFCCTLLAVLQSSKAFCSHLKFFFVF